jgi:hypothetical protein
MSESSRSLLSDLKPENYSVEIFTYCFEKSKERLVVEGMDQLVENEMTLGRESIPKPW